MKIKTVVLNERADAGNPHVRFDEGEVASVESRRGLLLYRRGVRGDALHRFLRGVVGCAFAMQLSFSACAGSIYNYYWTNCQGLTGFGDNYQIDNVVGFVESYWNGSSGFEKCDCHCLDLEVGQTARLTFTLVTDVGNRSLKVAVAPYTRSGEKLSGVSYSIPREIRMLPPSATMLDYAASAGWGFMPFSSGSFTITVKCVSAEHRDVDYVLNKSARTVYTYSVTSMYGTQTFKGEWPDSVNDSRLLPYKRGGVAIFTCTDMGSIANHDWSISYSISGSVSMEGGSTSAPANDAFSNAKTLSGASGSATGTNVGATSQSGEPTHGESGSSNSVWWKWTAPSSGSVTMTTEGSSFDTGLAVYTGASVGSLTEIAKNGDAAGGRWSSVTFDVQMGTTYRIAVAGYQGAGGSIKLNWNLRPANVAPPAPTGVVASDGSYSDKIRVSWPSVNGATSYNLYRSTTSSRPSSATKTGVTSPYSDATVESGVRYYYWVEAVNSYGSSISSYETGYRAFALSLGKSTESYESTGGSGNVSVTAEAAWSVTADVDWISFGSVSGNGSGTLTYAVAKNTTGALRVGLITVTVGSGSAYPATMTLQVSQFSPVPEITGDWYVDAARGRDSFPGTSWTQPFVSLQKAIDVAKDGQLIVVNDGVYGAIDAKGKTLTIRSVNGAKRTRIDGKRKSRCATLSPGRTELEGFSLVNGNVGEYQNGGGALGGVLRECHISACSAVLCGFGGGAVSNVLYQCVVAGNYACVGGGGYECEWHDCIISNNQAGVARDLPGQVSANALKGLDVIAIMTELSGGAGGIFCGSAERCIICNNCVRKGVRVGGGAACSARLESCLVVNNEVVGSSAQEHDNCNAGGVVGGSCVNCTIAGNRSSFCGPSDVHKASLTNCIVKNVSAGSIWESDCCFVCVNDTSVEGTGMIYADPQFEDEAAGDFRLKADSPCVDAGNRSVVSAEFDVIGQPRVVGKSVDVGAYEWQDAMQMPFETAASKGVYDDFVSITWTAAGAAMFYDLYRSTSPSRPGTPIKMSVKSPCYDTSAEPGVKYYYWAVAVLPTGMSVSSPDSGLRAVSVSLDNATDSCLSTGGVWSVRVTANTSWCASTDVDWITIGEKTGNRNGTLTYTVAENSSPLPREGIITVVAGAGTEGEKTALLTVSQNRSPVTVTFDAAGGMPTGESLKLEVGTAYGTLPADPSRPGYSFDGWYDGETRVTSATIASDRDLTVQAKWRANTSTVSFRSEHRGIGAGTMESQAFDYGTPAALAGCGFTRVGYAFAGWATEADGPAVYRDGQDVLNLSTEDGAKLEFYAVWEEVKSAESVKVTACTATPRWPWNGKVDVDYALACEPAAGRAAVNLTARDNDRQRDLQPKTLVGDGANGLVGSGTHRITWDVAADYPGFDTTALDINVEASVETIPAVEGVTASQGTSEGVELSWSPVNEAVAYEVWRGESENLDDAELIATVSDSAYSDMAIEFGKGYSYWVRPLSADRVGEFGDRVLGQGPFKVAFDANGGTGTMAALGVVNGGSLTVPECAFVYVGKSCVGWATSPEGDVVYRSGESLHDVRDNVLLYAIWEDFNPTKTYLVVDLSSGSSATSYPLSELEDVPSDGWTDEYKTCKLVLRRIANGSFAMGSPVSEIGHNPDLYGDEDLHSVTITKPFYMGVFEVTQKQWELVMGSAPSTYKGDARPVETVSYNMIRGSSEGSRWPTTNAVDDASFMGVIRARTGLLFDLPTEAQWEYTCRAGTTTALNSGKNLTNTRIDGNVAEVGRYRSNNGYNGTGTGDGKGGYNDNHTTVGSYRANNWGLYDMHGNVWELCLDWWTPRLGNADTVDPKGEYASYSLRAMRGGGWGEYAHCCRSASRTSVSAAHVSAYDGFRLCCPAGL